MTIYLLKYNNYYNRTIKRYSTINELLDRDDVVEIGTFQNVNFNPGDGVATQLTLNYTEGPAANYLVVEDTDGTFSSWFILDAQYVRFGQYTLSLRRDLVNDLWDTLADSPLFVEKATLSASSPLLYNRENMTFNQIKTAEATLFDETRIPWIVGYINKDFTGKVNIAKPSLQVDREYDGWEEYPYNNFRLEGAKVAYNPSFALNFAYSGADTTYHLAYVWNKDKQVVLASPVGTFKEAYVYTISGLGIPGYPAFSKASQTQHYLSPLQEALEDTSFTQFLISDYATDTIDKLHEADLLAEVGKVYKVDNLYYRMKLERNNTVVPFDTVDVPMSSALGLEMKRVAQKMIEKGLFAREYSGNSTPFKLGYYTMNYNLVAEQIQDTSFEIDFSATRQHTLNAPYDIFCIPYGSIGWGAATNFIYQKNGAWELASAIIKAAGTGDTANLYDIQLLPYCPIQDRIRSYGGSSDPLQPDLSIKYIELGEDDITLSYTAEGDLLPTYYAGLAWVREADFSFSIEAPTRNEIGKALAYTGEAIEAKVRNECDILRLTSPNYNGVFEFSAQKNGGVASFDIDCSYKPHQPYIRISPSFGGLYGRDFNDARGLILGGDFSLPQINSEWTAYQNQNKNYQVMFDRQITNMDVNNSIQRKMELGNVITGTFTGAATGGMIGSMTPLGGLGIAAGAVVGGIASGVGGILDRKYNEQLRQEARDYTIDQFGYQLGNIQARPDSLTKVSSFNPNNKFFPVLEYYTATDTEKQALRNKIKYNGMTVMVIGTISEYLQTEPSYIKGRLIRLNNDMEDYHIVNALADELYQGVYV